MKSIYLLLAFFGLVLTSCQSQPLTGSVDAITFNTKINTTKNAIVLDVRTPEEYAGGYIGNAVNIDFYKPSFQDEIRKLDKDKTYFVYCQAGGRSKSAYEVMKKEGFAKVYELNGGISEWQSSNLPLTVKPD
jgi:rhodanese-related sulfurtransferase